MVHQMLMWESFYMQCRNEYPLSSDFNLGTTNVIDNTSSFPGSVSPPIVNNFLLLDNSDFLLLDGTDLLLL